MWVCVLIVHNQSDVMCAVIWQCVNLSLLCNEKLLPCCEILSHHIFTKEKAELIGKSICIVCVYLCLCHGQTDRKRIKIIRMTQQNLNGLLYGPTSCSNLSSNTSNKNSFPLTASFNLKKPYMTKHKNKVFPEHNLFI